MTSSPVRVLELNNIDAFGKRFNGFSLAKFANENPNPDLDIKMLVNHKLEDSPFIFDMLQFKPLRDCDRRIEIIENSLGTKNQFSVTENALKNHPLYQNADILHFHMYHNMHLPIEFLNRIPSDKKIIIDLHDTFWLTDKNIPMLEVFNESNLNQKSLSAQKKRILNNIDAHFVLHSPYMLDLFKKSENTRTLKATMIEFGTDLSVFRPMPQSKVRSKNHISPNDFVIFFRAQNEFKGLNYIIDALNSFESTKNVTLITVGEENLCEALNDKYKVINFGYVKEENKLAELYNACDIFLAPSTEESFGFMAIEAMACAKPIIVFDGTALPHTCNAPKIGISVPRSSQSLAQAIAYLASNEPERLERGKLGREFAEIHYDEKKYIQENLKLYQEISTKSRHPSKSNIPSKNPIAKLNYAKIEQVALGESPTTILEPKKINYNNRKIQKSIRTFNTKLYNDCLKNTRPGYTLQDVIKRFSPHKLFHKIASKIRSKNG